MTRSFLPHPSLANQSFIPRSMFTLARPARNWRLAFELLNHGQAQPIQRIRSFVVLATLIVAQKRKN
jgi:hypothetical protein